MFFQLKDSGNKLHAKLNDADSLLERVIIFTNFLCFIVQIQNKTRFETLSEELDRIRIQKQIQMRDAHYNDLIMNKKPSTFGNFFKKNVTEDDLSLKVRQAKDSYQSQLTYTTALRQEFYSIQLPSLLKVLILIYY